MIYNKISFKDKKQHNEKEELNHSKKSQKVDHLISYNQNL